FQLPEASWLPLGFQLTEKTVEVCSLSSAVRTPSAVQTPTNPSSPPQASSPRLLKVSVRVEAVSSGIAPAHSPELSRNRIPKRSVAIASRLPSRDHSRSLKRPTSSGFVFSSAPSRCHNRTVLSSPLVAINPFLLQVTAVTALS